MEITSYVFVLAFLPITIAGWTILNKTGRNRIADIFLTLASMAFIWSYDYRFVLLLTGTIVVNYSGTQFLERLRDIRGRKIVLIILIALNLGILVFLKYGNWIRNLLTDNTGVWKWILPIGISFYTLEQICYIVDSYREETNYSLSEYMLFSTYFPVILSGPILRHDEFIGQLRNEKCRTISAIDISEGLISFCLGMGKKVIIASWLGSVAALGFENIQEAKSYIMALSVIAYTLQLYFDFSGYCDIVEGISMMIGFRLPINFNSPYKSLSIGEFWKRWHMTLTGFLTKYVYIPLGGNRRGKVRQYINILLVFIVSGFWHGASFTFVLWGIMHGMCMIVDKMAGSVLSILPKLVRQITTFLLVALMWIPFRAESISDTYAIYKILLFGNRGWTEDLGSMTFPVISYILERCNIITGIWLIHYQNVTTILIMIILLFAVFYGKNVREIRVRSNKKIYMAVFCGFILFGAVLQFSEIGTFIYEGF